MKLGGSGGDPRRYFVISAVPLLLMTVVTVPFALATRDPTDWARKTVVTLTQVGLALSLILFTIGAVLTLQANMAGDRRAATVLALETALAGLPVGIVVAYAALMHLL